MWTESHGSPSFRDSRVAKHQLTGNPVFFVRRSRRTIINGIKHEALYITSLTGAIGATLDLNNLWVYVEEGGSYIPLTGPSYNGITLLNVPSAIPIPGSVLLLGTGLVGLGLLRFRRRQSN